MVRQIIYILDYDWVCKVYYDARPDDAQEILDKMESIGCDKYDLLDAEYNLTSGLKNNGVTYSNFRERNSVMVIGQTSSAAEFQDTFDHEKNHLAKHITQASGIDPLGEEASYLSGAIGHQMFVVARFFLCEHCRKSRGIGKD